MHSSISQGVFLVAPLVGKVERSVEGPLLKQIHCLTGAQSKGHFLNASHPSQRIVLFGIARQKWPSTARSWDVSHSGEDNLQDEEKAGSTEVDSTHPQVNLHLTALWTGSVADLEALNEVGLLGTQEEGPLYCSFVFEAVEMQLHSEPCPIREKAEPSEILSSVLDYSRWSSRVYQKEKTNPISLMSAQPCDIKVWWPIIQKGLQKGLFLQVPLDYEPSQADISSKTSFKNNATFPCTSWAIKHAGIQGGAQCLTAEPSSWKENM